MPDPFDLLVEQPNPHAFIQWKGTDVCMDFHCECGAHCHFDGYFAYTVECPHCKVVWQMPSHVYPRKADEKTYEYHRNNPQKLEPDEDYSHEEIDENGCSVLVPDAVNA